MTNKSEVIKAYKHKGIDYKLIVIRWPDNSAISYLSKEENEIILASSRVNKNNHWLVLSCYHDYIANGIREHWLNK